MSLARNYPKRGRADPNIEVRAKKGQGLPRAKEFYRSMPARTSSLKSTSQFMMLWGIAKVRIGLLLVQLLLHFLNIKERPQLPRH